jgi:anti-anti-sigma regulatory factor
MIVSTGLRIDQSFRDGAAVVVPYGVLDLASYAELRDTLVKCAIELPRGIVVDVGGLRVPTTATLAVFSSVWMQVSDWPGVPIVLVAGRELDRRRLGRTTITRVMPVYASVEEALDKLGEPPQRRRTILELPDEPASVAAGRRFVEVTCVRWGCPEVLRDAVLVASELIENAVRHAHGDPRLRLELGGPLLTVAVYDDDPAPPQMINSSMTAPGHLGLVMVAKLAKSWSSAPTLSGGKVVWAVLAVP